MAVNGRRVVVDSEGHLRLAEGDYGQEADGTWTVRPPGRHSGGIPEHEVEEHEDGTITVTPSILFHGTEPEGEYSDWHGFLRRGVWSEA